MRDRCTGRPASLPPSASQAAATWQQAAPSKPAAPTNRGDLASVAPLRQEGEGERLQQHRRQYLLQGPHQPSLPLSVAVQLAIGPGALHLIIPCYRLRGRRGWWAAPTAARRGRGSGVRVGRARGGGPPGLGLRPCRRAEMKKTRSPVNKEQVQYHTLHAGSSNLQLLLHFIQLRLAVALARGRLPQQPAAKEEEQGYSCVVGVLLGYLRRGR